MALCLESFENSRRTPYNVGPTYVYEFHLETSLILCREEIKSDTNKKAKRYANFRTTCKTKSRLNSIEETIGNQFNGELEATKMGSKKNSVAPDFIISEEELKNEVFKIWNENGTKDKFVELEELMARRNVVKTL